MNQERLVERFIRYVSCGSESYHERAFCLLLEKELEALGLRWERQEIGEQFGSDGWNLHAFLPGGGEPLLLSAHMDTVSPGTGISPVVENGVIHSGGTTVLGGDDKAGVAAAMEAVETIIEGKLAHRPVELLFTICEEVGLLGAKYADYSAIASKEAIVLDNEEPGHIVNQTAAHLKLRFTILGRSAHAGLCPEKGVHALKAAAECVAGIRCGHVSESGVVNAANFLCPGQTNVVPDRAEFDVEIRSYDEAEARALAEEICAHVERTCGAWGAECRRRESRVSGAFCVPPEAPVVANTCAAMESLGIVPCIEKTLGGSDLTWLAANGLEAVNIGVGMREVHGCKEYIRVQDIVSTAEILLRVLTA